MTALNFQDYCIGRITDTDEDGNQFWVRFAKPFSVGMTNWLMRASLPVNSYPVAADGGLATGIGDLNVFAAGRRAGRALVVVAAITHGCASKKRQKSFYFRRLHDPGSGQLRFLG